MAEYAKRYNNNRFSTLQYALLRKCAFTSNELSTKNTNLGPPAPNHRNFLLMIVGKTSETIADAAASN